MNQIRKISIIGLVPHKMEIEKEGMMVTEEDTIIYGIISPGTMHYAVGQTVYGGHNITDIIEKDGKYDIFIMKGDEVKRWKTLNKNVAIVAEYNLDY